MSQKLPDSYALLASLGRLWPIGGNLLIVVQEATRVCRSDRQGTDALGGGEDEHERIFLPWVARCTVPVAAPQVYYFLPLMVDGARCTQFSPIQEVLPEFGFDLLESRLNCAMNRYLIDLTWHLVPPFQQPSSRPMRKLSKAWAKNKTPKG